MIVEVYHQFVVEESEVETQVVGLHSLPSQSGVTPLCHVSGKSPRVAVVVIILIYAVGELGIKVVAAWFAIGIAYLHVAESLVVSKEILEEFLIMDIPCSTYRDRSVEWIVDTKL